MLRGERLGKREAPDPYEVYLIVTDDEGDSESSARTESPSSSMDGDSFGSEGSSSGPSGNSSGGGGEGITVY